MNQCSYTLYLDETGDRGLVNFNPQYPVLGLCACIVDDRVYEPEVVAPLDAFKIRWFGTARLTLRYSAIMKRTGPYLVLAKPDRMYAFEREFAALVASLPITVLASVINKQEYAADTVAAVRPPKDPTWPRDLYHVAFDFILERFVEFLEQRRGVGTIVIAEARGKREDRQLSEHYYNRRTTPTQFYSTERFALLPGRLEFRGKSDQVAGLELADLLGPQIASCTLGYDAGRLLVWQATRPKSGCVVMIVPAGSD